jgi:hypothetical protein
MKMKFVVFCFILFFLRFPLSILRKRFQNNSTMISEPLDVFSVFLLMPKL